jgi:hypothetical protein
VSSPYFPPWLTPSICGDPYFVAQENSRAPWDSAVCLGLGEKMVPHC